MGAAIEVQGVGKRFKLQSQKVYSLKERLIHFRRTDQADFWALRDIDLDIARGETIGLLGHNGSGKSTLLKCISGILRPTTGTIRRSGRIAALLELGAGFHPDLTGRENVFLNGSILGLSKVDVARIFDDVVAFAELEDFIDTQVKHYSSGMYARLGFAVAVNVDPEILLVDEVLSVGDESFQRKCLDRIREFQREGRTIVIVTHSVDIVRQHCHHAAVLDHGRMIANGPAGEAIREFRRSMLHRAITSSGITTDHSVRITGMHIEYPPDRRHFLPGEALRFHLDYEADDPVDDVAFTVNIYDEQAGLLMGTSTDDLGVDVGVVKGRGTIVWEVEQLPLLDGSYTFDFTAHDLGGGTVYDIRSEYDDTFEVVNPGHMRGRVWFPLRAEVRPEPPPG